MLKTQPAPVRSVWLAAFLSRISKSVKSDFITFFFFSLMKSTLLSLHEKKQESRLRLCELKLLRLVLAYAPKLKGATFQKQSGDCLILLQACTLGCKGCVWHIVGYQIAVLIL